MILKSLTIQGFKSFANKTKIEFNKDVTAIVGPNGSGKSNITDAIMWVLGENSVKNLRGSRMEDVIFQGTDTKKPLGLAEVTIVFDNADGLLDTKYSEVSVTRRMFRSLESEFLINNVKVRLKDIKELFMDTGIGKDGYSLVGQGKIDAILSEKSQDRRSVFEEAAGISKYKFKKGQAQNKLERTRANLVRLSDIIEEIENRELSLKTQSYQAKRYLKLFEELKLKEINYTYFANERLNKDLEKLKVMSISGENHLQELRNEIADANAGQGKLEEKNIEIEEEIYKIQDQINENNSNLEKSTSNIEILREKIYWLKNESESLINSKEISKEEIAKGELSLESFKKNLEELSDSEVDLGQRISGLKEEINLLNKEINEEEKSLQKDMASSLDLENQLKNIKFKNETLENIVLEKNERKTVLEKNIERLRENNLELEKSYNDNEKKLINLEEELKGLDKGRRLLEENLQKLTEANISDKKRLEDLSLKERELNGRIGFLKNLTENYEGYTKSVKSFMAFSQKNHLYVDSLIGTCGEEIRVEKKYEKAISVALGGGSQYIIVDSIKNVSQMIKILEREKFGRVTFMPLDSVKEQRDNLNIKNYENLGAIDFAVNLIDFDPKYYNIFSNLLGRIIVADTFENARTLGKKLNNRYRIVTLDGDIFNTGGSVTGGYINKSNLDLISRKNDLEKLRSKDLDLKEQIKGLEEKTLKDKLNLDNLIREGESLDQKIKAIEDVRTTCNNIKDKINSSKALNSDYEKRYGDELSTLKESLMTDQKAVSDNKILLEETLEKTNKAKNTGEDFSDKLKEKKEKFEALRENLQDLKLKEKEGQEKKIYLEREMERISKEILRAKNSLSSSSLREEEISGEIANKEEIGQEERINLSLFKDKKEALEENLRVKKEERQKFSEDLKNLRTQNDERKERLLELSQDLEKTRSQIERKTDQIDAAYQRLKEDYKIENIDEFIDRDLKKVALGEIKKLKADIDSLGNINLSAIGEYEEVKERLEFNLRQRGDLIKSSEEIESILRSLDREMKDLFKKSFREISENFSKIFKILFNGGEAEIELDGDYLEGGIEIKAMPPGKKLKSLSLLSGGEKVLTAIALLFSLLKVRPAPFCILDEIDAALDDANIKRYADYLLSLESTQFIIITHRKLTMEIASTMYGVTMEEKGISKIYSVELK